MNAVIFHETIAVINVLPSGTAFGVNSRGEGVFIPTSVANAAGVAIGDEVLAQLVPNARNPERTPHMAIFIAPKSAVPMQPPIQPEQPPQKKLTEKEVYGVVEDGYMTTSEIADWLEVDVTTASNLLNELHKRGLLAKATVFSKPDQQRASFCLWAKDLSGFADE